jgi:hypothetical protein
LFVPPLIAGLDTADAETVESAGLGLCVLASEQPEPVAEALAETLVENPTEKPVLRTLAALVERHDGLVRSALLAATDAEQARVLHGQIRDTTGWQIPDELRSETGDGELAEVIDACRAVVRRRESRDSDGATTGHVERDTGEARERDADPTAAAARAAARPRTVRKRHERIERVANSRTFQTIESRIRFDELDVVAPETKGRYGNVVRTRARAGDDEYGIAIRLCHRPGRGEFDDALTDTLAEWQALESEATVTAADWGEAPRPWLATEHFEGTLGGRDRLHGREVLDHARRLTAALATLHQQGVVHGGIDPSAVVYESNVLERRPRPMLDNVGLLSVYRQYDDPAEYLDPRFAAPEYFDGEFGAIDHATDIYQLGTVLYRACTGTTPFEGGFAAVREQVVAERPAPPSSSNPTIPDAFDEIIAKATAKQKLTRYETATQFHRDIRRLCDAVTD